jgi:hypothetical protein
MRWVEVQIAGHTTIINLSAWSSVLFMARREGKTYLRLGVDSLASGENSDGDSRGGSKDTNHQFTSIAME